LCSFQYTPFPIFQQMVRQNTTKIKQFWNTTIVKKDLFNEILGSKEYEVIETLLGCTTQHTSMFYDKEEWKTQHLMKHIVNAKFWGCEGASNLYTTPCPGSPYQYWRPIFSLGINLSFHFWHTMHSNASPLALSSQRVVQCCQQLSCMHYSPYNFS
jgi:hypothetical protein